MRRLQPSRPFRDAAPSFGLLDAVHAAQPCDMKFPLVCSLLVSLAVSLVRAHDANIEMAQAAKNFAAALTPEQKAKAMIPFADAERENWHFVPRARKGLAIKEMSHEQRLLAHALLASGMSHRGYGKAVSIMSLEGILADLEKGRGGGANRDSELYFVTIFGEPGSGAQPWGWRVEGHHLSLNFTSGHPAGTSMTPSFFGSNPGEVRDGPRAGIRVLEAEEELARQLVKSLDEEQRTVAVLQAEAPKDILNMPGRSDTKPEGLPQSRLRPEQSAMLMKLIKEYVDRHRPDVAAEDLARIEKNGLGAIHFAWAGGFERGQPHYYRVQSGGFVLEYDNTQNGANHVHSVWRDFSRDFGADLLGKHYEQAHPAK